MRVEIIKGDGWRFETYNVEIYVPDKYCVIDVETAEPDELEDLVGGEVLGMTRLQDYYFGRAIDPLTEEMEPWFADEDRDEVRDYVLSEYGGNSEDDIW